MNHRQAAAACRWGAAGCCVHAKPTFSSHTLLFPAVIDLVLSGHVLSESHHGVNSELQRHAARLPP